MSAWILVLAVAPFDAGLAALAQGKQDPEPVDFHGRVLPLLAVRCHGCHGAEQAKGKLRLHTREGVVRASTELLRRVSLPEGDEDRMPPEGTRLAAEEVDLLRRWIAGGTAWPDRDDYWAFLPPRATSEPLSIDSHVDRALAKAGLVPAGEADRRTLLRRAHADLVGVPPSPEEAEAFLAARSPDAFERLVDRLLADPRHGERWARKWLDLARYSESNGYEDDKIRPHAWRYRDYVIRSLNADKPFDRFVQEQIAGDELWPADPDAWIATGFARLGPWDGMSMEPAVRHQDYLNDATDAVGAVFLGMTVGCARCHDHKFDRITQADYYSLQAFFAGSKREDRDLPGAVADPPSVREAWAAARDALAAARKELDALRREAREEILVLRRCDVAPDGEVKITDDEIHKRLDRFHPGARARLEARIKEQGVVEKLHRPAAEAVLAAPGPAPKTHLLRQGNLAAKGPETPPRFVEAMCPPGGATPPAGGRPALARWLTSPEHPLVARVIVNRLWQEHFGRGLVATPSDFGRNGGRPTHPELLDALAVDLVRSGWSLRATHRKMMLSAAWRRASGSPPSSDPENRLLAVANRRRLDAESIRDGILAVSGRLHPAAGGPGVYAPIPKELNVMLPNNDKELSWGTAPEAEGRRRSVYLFQRRSLTYPMIEVFDGPTMNQSCPRRPETTVAPQALTLFNGEFCRDEARALAERALRESPGDPVGRAFLLAFTRAPSAAERARCADFLARSALPELCHVLLNANEFVTLD
jgi:hypothetical protein